MGRSSQRQGTANSNAIHLTGARKEPEELLWTAVLSKAADDALYTSDYREALLSINWFETSGRDFRSVCQYAGRDHNYVSRKMLEQGGGVILNISSDLGVIAPDQRLYKKNFVKPVSYSVVKHGILGLTKYLASYWGSKNIRCNAFAPGGMKNNNNISIQKKIEKLIPINRMANINEYNDIILFLASDSSSYINGATIIADGGRSII